MRWYEKDRYKEDDGSPIMGRDYCVADRSGYGEEWTLNGLGAPDMFFSEFAEWLEKHLRSATHCPFCTSALRIKRHKEPSTESSYRLWWCVRCRYWQWDSWTVLDEPFPRCTSVINISALSKLREFEVALPEGVHKEAAQHLRRNPDLWHSVDPHGLERLVAAIFQANHTHCEVMHVGGPNDGGKDVLFVDDNRRQWLIQVKRRVHAAKGEPVSTLRNLLGAMVLHQGRHGMVVSTVDHFSYRMRQAAGRAAEVGMTVKLINKHLLDRMLEPLLPPFPWQPLLEAELPDLVETFCGSKLPLFPKL